jgi:putative mRNA 3-end processing factor
MMSLIEFTDKGLYCPQGGFYIDPWDSVAKAVITHAHSDHARAGSGAYLCHRLTVPLLEARLGYAAAAGGMGWTGAGEMGWTGAGGMGHGALYQGVEWGEPVFMNGVRVSLHPAGHIIGSSQVRVEYQGEVWVVSGDYKTEDDGISGAFEPVKCHVFVTESTFGLPIYDWKPQPEIFGTIQDWVVGNRERGKASVLIAYSLGKAQRLLSCLEPVTEKIYVHGAVWNIHQALVNAGVVLPAVERVTPEMPREWFKGQVVIAPSSAEGSPWIRKFQPFAIGVCSGWMQVRGNVRRRNADAGFALSDHADWRGLLGAIEATGAEKVYVTHGFQATLARYLNEQGIAAAEVKTAYGEDEEGGESVVGKEGDVVIEGEVDAGEDRVVTEGAGGEPEVDAGGEDAGHGEG